MRHLCLLALFVFLMPVASRAQVLVDSVPADAMIYIAWQGQSERGDAYEQSHLKPVLEASQIPELVTKFLPAFMQRIGREERDAQPVLDLIGTLAEPMWKHSTAIYFAGVDTANPDMPLPRLAVLIHAKDQAPALVNRLRQRLNALAQQGQLPPGQITAVEQAGVVAIAIGPPLADGSLANNDRFKSAMAKVQADPVIAAYVDAHALLDMVDALIEANEPNDMQDWERIRDALNLRGIHRIAYTGGFDGPNWADRIYIAAPSPRTGIAMLLDAQPIDQQTLRLIPQDATLAMAVRLDLARMLEQTRQAVTQADPQAGEKLENGLLEINETIGINLSADLLDPLGDQWAVYVAPSVGGNAMTGFALVNRLDDAQKVDQALTTLAQRASEAIAANMNAEVTIEFKESQTDDVRVRYLAVPLVAPAWAVHEGNLYVGLYPQVVVAAARHDAEGGSLLDNDKYKDVMARLGADQPGSVQFIDMAARVPQGYAAWLAMSRLYLGMADMMGVQSPAMVLPPLNVIMQNLTPAGAVSWSDDDGYYAISQEPFPGSTGFATTDASSSVIGQQAMMASIMLPSLNRARETANRVKCASNLRQIGQAMFLYANENRQQYPKTLGELVVTQDISVEVFVCPSSNNSVPAHIRNAPLEQQAAWVNEHGSYVYLAPPTANVHPEMVMVHEAFHNHRHDGINMLFGDGHVSFWTLPQAQQDIEKSRKAFQTDSQ